MVSFKSYIGISFATAACVVYHAFVTRQRFFTAVMFLSNSKVALATLGNFAFAVALLLHKLVVKVFLGTLRGIEWEMVRERLSSAVMESLLALTIFREGFSNTFVVMFAFLLFIKVFHWLVQDRVDYVEVTPHVSALQHLRLVALMGLLLTLDTWLLTTTVRSALASGGASASLLFAFEYGIQLLGVVRCMARYAFSAADLAMEGRWEGKSAAVFQLELAADLLRLLVYTAFFGAVFANYGLPLHLVRDLYSTYRNFRNRLTEYWHFRQVNSRLDRIADATAADLARSDNVCIVCREEMTASGANKRLACGHVFHLHCLRAWLERQQSCPTCRTSISADASPSPAPAPAAANQPPQPADAGADAGEARAEGAASGTQATGSGPSFGASTGQPASAPSSSVAAAAADGRLPAVTGWDERAVEEALAHALEESDDELGMDVDGVMSRAATLAYLRNSLRNYNPAPPPGTYRTAYPRRRAASSATAASSTDAATAAWTEAQATRSTEPAPGTTGSVSSDRGGSTSAMGPGISLASYILRTPVGVQASGGGASGASNRRPAPDAFAAASAPSGGLSGLSFPQAQYPYPYSCPYPYPYPYLYPYPYPYQHSHPPSNFPTAATPSGSSLPYLWPLPNYPYAPSPAGLASAGAVPQPSSLSSSTTVPYNDATCIRALAAAIAVAAVYGVSSPNLHGADISTATSAAAAQGVAVGSKAPTPDSALSEEGTQSSRASPNGAEQSNGGSTIVVSEALASAQRGLGMLLHPTMTAAAVAAAVACSSTVSEGACTARDPSQDLVPTKVQAADGDGEGDHHLVSKAGKQAGEVSSEDQGSQGMAPGFKVNPEGASRGYDATTTASTVTNLELDSARSSGSPLSGGKEEEIAGGTAVGISSSGSLSSSEQVQRPSSSSSVLPVSSLLAYEASSSSAREPFAEAETENGFRSKPLAVSTSSSAAPLASSPISAMVDGSGSTEMRPVAASSASSSSTAARASAMESSLLTAAAAARSAAAASSAAGGVIQAVALMPEVVGTQLRAAQMVLQKQAEVIQNILDELAAAQSTDRRPGARSTPDAADLAP